MYSNYLFYSQAYLTQYHFISTHNLSYSGNETNNSQHSSIHLLLIRYLKKYHSLFCVKKKSQYLKKNMSVRVQKTIRDNVANIIGLWFQQLSKGIIRFYHKFKKEKIKSQILCLYSKRFFLFAFYSEFSFYGQKHYYANLFTNFLLEFQNIRMT